MQHQNTLTCHFNLNVNAILNKLQLKVKNINQCSNPKGSPYETYQGLSLTYINFGKTGQFNNNKKVKNTKIPKTT